MIWIGYIWGGVATIIAALLLRRPKTLRVGGVHDSQFGGFTVTVKHVTDSSMVLERDGSDAIRCRIIDGRAVVEWEDGRFSDIAEMTRNRLWRHGPAGAMSIRGR